MFICKSYTCIGGFALTALRCINDTIWDGSNWNILKYTLTQKGSDEPLK